MKLLDKEAIKLDVEITNPIEGIREAGERLVQTNQVLPSYVEEMVKAFQEIGPYIVIAPGIALPHARPEHGVLKQALSVVRLNKPIPFGHPTNDPVQLICAIGGNDQSKHINMLQQVSKVLGSSEKLNSILQAKSKEEVADIFNQA